MTKSILQKIDTSAAASDVSAAGGVFAVSARNTVNVSAEGGAFAVSARNIVNVSAAGGSFRVSTSADVAVDTSVRNTVDVSAQGGVVATSVRNTADVSAQGGTFAVSARNIVDVSAAGGVVATSVRNAVSGGGRFTTYFALPAGHIVDGAQAEARVAVNISGASAASYALVSAPASGVTRISRLFLTFGSAARPTFVNISAQTSSISLTGPLFVDDRGSIVLDKGDSPWFMTTGTKNFSINVSAGVGITGAVYWY